MEAEEGPGVKAAVEASPKTAEVAAEATTAEMSPAEAAAAEVPSTTEVSATTEAPATAEVPAAAEMPAAEVPATTDVPAAVAHADGVGNAAGKRERQEHREPESRGGGQRSANGLELHAPSLVAARSPVKGCPRTARLPGHGREAGADTSYGPRPGAAGRRGAVPGDRGGVGRQSARWPRPVSRSISTVMPAITP